MTLIVLPSEITEGKLSEKKALRGFAVEKKKKTTTDGKTIVELHIAAKPDSGELYLLEAWGAAAARADKLQNKAHDLSGFIAKSALTKAAWTPSAAATWGLLGPSSQWKEVPNADGLPTSYPTLSLQKLQTITSVLQVCVRGLLKDITIGNVSCKHLPQNRGFGRASAAAASAASQSDIFHSLILPSRHDILDIL